jgi:uncharacterized membrane protein HdeD (DUF308 family)
MFKSPATSLILRGVLALIVGILALAWPLPTALVLVLIAGVWAIAGGTFEFFSAFTSGLTAGTRALDIVTGLLLIAFGVLLFARPGAGAVTFALLFGLFNLFYGAAQITRGAEIRSRRRDLHAASPHARTV